MFRPVDPTSLPTTFERFVTAPLNQVAKIALAILKSIGAVLAMPFQAIHRLFVNHEANFIGEIEKQLRDIQGNFSETTKAQYEISRSLHRIQLDINFLITNLKRELEAFSYHNYAFEPVDKQQDEAFFDGLRIEKNEPIESLKEKLTKLEQYLKGLENRKIYKSENSLTLPENHQAVINQEGGRFQKHPRWMEFFEKLNKALSQDSLQTLDLFAKSLEKLESYQREIKAGLPSETNCSQAAQKLISGCKEELTKVAECIKEQKKTHQEFRAYTERDFVERFVKFKSSVDSLENYTDNVACFIASTTPYNPSEHPYIRRFRELLASSTPPVSATHAEDGLVAAIEPSSLGGGRAANLQEASVEFPVLSLRQQDSVPKKADSNRQHNRRLRSLDGKTE